MSDEKSADPRNLTLVIEIETGDIINGKPGGPDETKLPDPHTVLVAWAENSPGCVYVKHGGVWKKICR